MELDSNSSDSNDLVENKSPDGEDSPPDHNDSEDSKSPEPDTLTCLKLKIPENLKAKYDKNNLFRESEIISIDCPKDVIAKVFNNYVIIKNIIKFLPWQDKLICTDVCSLWKSAVSSLANEQLHPLDFSINLTIKAVKKGIEFKRSGNFYTAPLAVFVFCNAAALNEYGTAKCLALLPNPCQPPCEKEHSILDMIQRETCGTEECMFVSKAYNLGYLPLLISPTYNNAIKKLNHSSIPYYCGLFIPKIPGVKFRSLSTATAKEHTAALIQEIKRAAEECIIKAMIINITDHYMVYVRQGQESFLDCIHEIQPNAPFALGGCLVEDTFVIQEDLDDIIANANNEIDRITCKQVSIGLFVVPKSVDPPPVFEVYSCVNECSAWTKPQIQQDLREFSKRVPRYEHSVALKYSCAGRMNKHEVEQNYFRTLFPDTPIAGCFGNGEFGRNYPTRPPLAEAPQQPKKPKKSIAYENVHSYSTVFMYFGWGKVVQPAEIDG